jgi:HEAT repeat protein
MPSVSVFEDALTGGHHNSLGNTVAVAEQVNADRSLLPELINTYASEDEVVRLRVSSALKRVAWEHPDWIHAEIDSIMEWVERLQQPSAQWSVGQMLLAIGPRLSTAERDRAVALMKSHIESSSDWIVLNHTMETLAQWAVEDPELEAWLVPHLSVFATDSRKSIAKRAQRLLGKLGA